MHVDLELEGLFISEKMGWCTFSLNLWPRSLFLGLCVWLAKNERENLPLYRPAVFFCFSKHQKNWRDCRMSFFTLIFYFVRNSCWPFSTKQALRITCLRKYEIDDSSKFVSSQKESILASWQQDSMLLACHVTPALC